jgi:hypothetical protein
MGTSSPTIFDVENQFVCYRELKMRRDFSPSWLILALKKTPEWLRRFECKFLGHDRLFSCMHIVRREFII